MKKLLAVICLAITLHLSAQNKITVRELLFYTGISDNCKITHVAEKGDFIRVLHKVRSKNNEPVSKYILVEYNGEEKQTDTFFIVSKNDLTSAFDIFSLNTTNTAIIYFDPGLDQLLNQPGDQKKIKVVMKHAELIIESNTMIEIPDCNYSSEVQYCIDWYWQTLVSDVMVEEQYQFTTCDCHPATEGGGSDQGPEYKDSPQKGDCSQMKYDAKGTPVLFYGFNGYQHTHNRALKSENKPIKPSGYKLF